MELWIASSNKGKIREFESLLQDLLSCPVEIYSQDKLPVYSSPLETGDSFEANARIKARTLHVMKKKCWVLADDSGLEVEGLNNLPGVHSARYAGDKATDVENTTKVLKMINLRSATHRQAQFRCFMIAYSPDGTEHLAEGVLKGKISHAMSGTRGFGYDNIFIPEGQDKTLAEITSIEKNKISHRAMALRQLAKLFNESIKEDTRKL